MSAKARLVRGFLLRLLAWSLVAGAAYVALLPHYQALVIWLAEGVLQIVHPVEIQTAQKGLIFQLAGIAQEVGLPYRLASIGVNVVFAVALVLATVGIGVSGLLRTAAAILLMAALHALQVASILLAFLVSDQNTTIAVEVAPAAATTVNALYKFLDKMGYAFMPLLVWFAVCIDYLGRYLARSRTSADAASPQQREPE